MVVQVASKSSPFQPGDEVYAFAMSRPMDVTAPHGFCSEYAVVNEDLMLRKPANCSFEDLCNLASTVTAYQAIEQALEKMRENGTADGLAGKTVFVPAALSATGSVAIQLLKNVYGVGRLLSTVSTPKVPLVEQLLPGLVDQVVDYTKMSKLTDAIPKGTVDLVYNTIFGVRSTFALAKPETGVVASIASVPDPALLRKMLPPLPWYAYVFAALAQWRYAWALRGTKVRHFMHSGQPSVRADLERAGEFMAAGKVKSVVRVVRLEDIEEVRREAMKVATGKGGVGKLVIKIV